MSAPTLPTRPVDWFRRVGTIAVVVLVVWSLVDLDIKWERLVDLPADLWRVAVLMFGDMPWDETGKLVAALWESVSIAWLGTMIASLFAIPLSFLAAENLVGRPVAWLTRQVFNVLRAVPEVILAIALIPIFGLTPMAGVLAIAIGSVGTLGKLFYEVAEGIKPGPIEAVDATGAGAGFRPTPKLPQVQLPSALEQTRPAPQQPITKPTPIPAGFGQQQQQQAAAGPAIADPQGGIMATRAAQQQQQKYPFMYGNEYQRNTA